MSDSWGWEAGNTYMSLEHLVVPEIKEMQKIKRHKAGVCQQDTGDMRQFPKLTI